MPATKTSERTADAAAPAVDAEDAAAAV